MLLVIQDLLFPAVPKLLQKSVVVSIRSALEVATHFEFFRAPHCEEFLQRWQSVKSDPRPQRCPGPANKRQTRLAGRSWHPGAHERDDGALMRSDTLALVQRQSPTKTKRKIHTQQ